ncbi:DNA-binding protein [Oligella urethralis]|uniref:DNA-binding protein n=1 Tax=Oligella urethralis TaxID=90245 RepID=UPI000E05EAA1|nr:DNA-binding protein [Oligella urethralis]SUA58044.1 phage-associated protein, BcepMu gp16 family [Oligella urethralis]
MKTPDQAKQALRAKGVTITEFARKNNFPAHAVYKVLNGQYKAHYGQAHEIAVALGLKKTSAHQAA